jgi:hypothetical protein
LKPSSNRYTTLEKSSYVLERIAYDISYEELKFLSMGSSGKVKIMGNDSYLVRYIYYVNFNYLKKFIEEPFNQIETLD